MSLVEVTDLSEGVARLTLTRGAKRNAVNAELAADFRSTVEGMVSSGVRSAVLAAEGPAFCAGADLKELETSGHAVDDVVDVLLGSPVHWAAVVRRPAFGAGLAILAACPLVIASEGAKFGLPELRAGFFPSALMAGQTALVGARAAYDLAFSAEPVDAARGREIGLVTELCADADADARAVERAEQVAARPVEAVRQGVAQWQALLRPQLLG